MRAIRQIISLGVLAILAHAAWGADYAREKKWADEITPGIVAGEPLYLQQGAHKFLAIYTSAANAKMALVVVHGLGIHPDWGMVSTLRTQLAEQGYTTLAIQMPVLANDAKAEAYPVTFPEAAKRIDVAVKFLHAKGCSKVAVVSHSMGSRMSRVYVLSHPQAIVAWASLGIGGGDTYSGVKVPVLDLYGEHDFPQVLAGVKKRAASLRTIPGSMQIEIPQTDHFYADHETEMVKAVKDFLDSIH